MDPNYHQSHFGAFLYHQNLASFKWLAHGFSLRSAHRGGPEQSLGFNDYQSQDTVESNRLQWIESVLAGSLHPKSTEADFKAARNFRLVNLRQRHSDVICALETPSTTELSAEGDGVTTDQAGWLLGVLTADCMPVFIVDTERRAVAAVHAGWRGTTQRILEKALATMRSRFASDPQHCIAVVGPAIRRCCYEVGEDVIEAFHGKFQYASQLFETRLSGKRFLDLPTACRFQLLDAGLKTNNIFSDPACTSCNLDQFFSHRAERGQTGRMMSAIGILAAR